MGFENVCLKGGQPELGCWRAALGNVPPKNSRRAEVLGLAPCQGNEQSGLSKTKTKAGMKQARLFTCWPGGEGPDVVCATAKRTRSISHRRARLTAHL